MEVTYTGWALIITGLALFLHHRMLLACFAATVTMSATAVVNLPDLPLGVQPYHWFGSLLIICAIMTKLKSFGNNLVTPLPISISFFCFILSSLASAYLSNDVARSLNHVAHIVFGYSTFAAVRTFTLKVNEPVFVLQWLIYGVIFAVLWGVLQILLFFLNLPYPSEVFNNSVGLFAKGFSSTLGGGMIPRMSSVATEPSFLARSIAPVVGLLVLLWARQERHFKLITKGSLVEPKFIILLVGLLLTTSSIGYAAMFAIAVIVTLKENRARILAIICAPLITVMGYFSLSNRSIALLFQESVLEKLSSGSGQIRISSVQNAFEIFEESPIFGAGPGQVTSDDLFVKLLSNFGLIGTFCFLSFLILIIRHSKKSPSFKSKGHRANLISSLIFANLLLWLMDAFGGVSYQYGIFWILLAILMSVATADRDIGKGRA